MPLDGSEFKFEIDETTKLLIAAREMVERGWCQGAIAMGGDVCAVGALTRNTKARAASLGALDGALACLQRALGDFNVPHWNDRPERTKEDVLSLYDIAISASLSGSAYP